ncbi:MAG: dTMP kinase [Pseudomonadota bacterium]
MPYWPPRAPGALFVTLEGPDGAGKSTQARALAARLEAAGHRVRLTREPGGAAGAEAIRQLLVTGEPGRWSAETEALLFTAARRDHVERVIAPALAAGEIVLCDRYIDSTRAYQAAAARDLVDALHHLAIGLDPDLTLILDIAPERALARATARAKAHATAQEGEDRFEQKGLGFQEALRGAFHATAAAEPTRCRIIDADAAPEMVETRLWEALSAMLPAPGTQP